MATLRERLAASDTDAALRLVAEARPVIYSKVAELRNSYLKNSCKLSDLTRDSYSADAARVARAGGDPRTIAGTYASFRKLRAACIWKIREDLRECLLNADRARKKGGIGELDALCQYDERLPDIEYRMAFLSSLKFHSDSAKRREKTHKQRHKLGRLPKDWLLSVHRHSKNGIYGEAFALGILIPVRPSEIAQRVSIKLNESNALVIEIKGSKIKTEGSGVAAGTNEIGQPLRRITLSAVDPIREEIFNWLRAKVIKNQGAITIGAGLTGKSIGSAFRAISRRTFPKLKSPPSFYALRHAACAELKATSADKETIASAMGHSSVESQKVYGAKLQGTGAYKFSATATNNVRSRPNLNINHENQLTKKRFTARTVSDRKP